MELVRYALIATADGSLAARCDALARTDHTTVLCRTGKDAVTAIESRGVPALAIVDLALAGVDGFELIARLRKHKDGKNAAVIAHSPFVKIRTIALERKAEFDIDEVLPSGAPVQVFEAAIRRSTARRSGAPVPAAAPRRPAPTPAPVSDAGIAAAAGREKSRIAAIEALTLSAGSTQDAALQSLVSEVAASFGVPIALVSLVMRDRQFFEAHVGLSGELLDNRGSAREDSFCTHLAEADVATPLVIPDAALHPLFGTNRFVRDGVFRSYAGAPLVTPGGQVLGSLCILDRKPLAISTAEVDRLVALARRVAGELEMRARAATRPQAVDAPIGGGHFAAILDGLEDGILVLDAGRRVTYANEPLAKVSGVARASIVGNPREQFIGSWAIRFADPDAFLRRMVIPPTGPYAAREDFEMVFPEPRVIRWIARPVALPGGAVGQLCIYRDITAESELARERERLAFVDPLTGLLNRRGGEDAMRRAGAVARRQSQPSTVVLLDIDHFKRVNDEHGHAAGDWVLQMAAKRLQESLRESDVLARWGGEEFVAFLPSTSIEQARVVAERARASISASPMWPGLSVTISGGLVDATGPDLEASLRAADKRLYEAKNSGRDRVL